ncbi:MAG: competence/damage-inducible protein A [Rhodothalassiaceae bacterium]
MVGKKERQVTAALVVIGDEILSGRTRDANLAYLATWLNARGIGLGEARIVPDRMAAIIEAVNALRARFDYVFTTGGIGPTHDDITAQAIADAFGVPLEEHPDAIALLSAHYPPGGLTPARRRMARVPKGGTLIDNPVSIAPGFQIGNVFVLAGVPEIMRVMLDSLAHRLVGGAPMQAATLEIPMPESAFAEPLAEIAAARPAVAIGSYPYYRKGRPGIHVVVRATDPAAITDAIDAVAAAARKMGVEPLGEGQKDDTAED